MNSHQFERDNEVKSVWKICLVRIEIYIKHVVCLGISAADRPHSSALIEIIAIGNGI